MQFATQKIKLKKRPFVLDFWICRSWAIM